jgi:hypothetical protein
MRREPLAWLLFGCSLIFISLAQADDQGLLGHWSPGGFLLFVQDHQCSFRMGRPGFSAVANREQWRETSANLLAPLELRQWYHLAATFKRPVITTYVNGRQVGNVGLIRVALHKESSDARHVREFHTRSVWSVSLRGQCGAE